MKCPGCEVNISDNAKSCFCGWSATGSVGMPTLNGLIAELDHIIKTKGRSACLSREDAAKWILTLLEKPNKTEAPRKIPVVGRDGHRWVWGYSERVKDCLNKFIHLSHDDQQTIIAARKEKIYWRGDDMDFFTMVIHETRLMREMGSDAYRKKIGSMMSNLRMGV